MRRVTWMALILGAIIGAALGSLSFYRLYVDAVDRSARLDQRLDEMASELDRERARTARGMIQDRMQLAARFELKEEVQRIEQERRKLGERNEFYERLLGERNAPEGISLERMEASSANGNRAQIHLVLAQVRQKPTVVRGLVEIGVSGILGGARTEIRPDKPVEYKFRFFQDLQATLLLPSGFVPDQINVRVKQGKSTIIDVSRPWASKADA